MTALAVLEPPDPAALPFSWLHRVDRVSVDRCRL